MAFLRMSLKWKIIALLYFFATLTLIIDCVMVLIWLLKSLTTMQLIMKLWMGNMLVTGFLYLRYRCLHRKASRFHSNLNESSFRWDYVLPLQLTRHRVRSSRMLVFISLIQHSHMVSYMLHCQGECRERRHGFWPSQTRTLINPGKAPRTLSTEMFWRDEAGALFHYFFSPTMFASKTSLWK